MATTQRIGKTATRVSLDPLRVTYHNTTVVEGTPSGIKLNSGGYRTVTTKLRMNQASNQLGLGFQVFAKKGEWFVERDGATLRFEDGMIL